jgi:hypothetical protein
MLWNSRSRRKFDHTDWTEAQRQISFQLPFNREQLQPGTGDVHPEGGLLRLQSCAFTAYAHTSIRNMNFYKGSKNQKKFPIFTREVG